MIAKELERHYKNYDELVVETAVKMFMTARRIYKLNSAIRHTPIAGLSTARLIRSPVSARD